MAESAGSSPATPEEHIVTSETPEQASFSVGKHIHTVSLSQTTLTWQRYNKKSAETNSARLRDLIAVDVKDATTNEIRSKMAVVYVTQKKDFLLRRVQVTFDGERDRCESFRRKMQEAIDTCKDRPRRLLVLINPVSGFSTGVKKYRNVVAPIFEEAKLETDVIVTEKAHHTEEILATYDLKSINGLVIVSGDGMYHEAANGLVRRVATDTGNDVNNPDYEPPEFPVTIGLIPCGTGNGIARAAVGNYDVVSAAYSVILGYKWKNNLFRVFSNRKLVTYKSLLSGFGLWGDVIYSAEMRRSMGVLRYPVTLIERIFFKSFRRMSLTLKFRAPPEYSESNDNAFRTGGRDTAENPEGESSAIKSNTMQTADGMTTITEEFIASICFCNPFKSINQVFIQPGYQPETTVSDLLLCRPCTKMQFIKFFAKFINFSDEFTENVNEKFPLVKVSEYEVTLNNASPPDTDAGRRERVMNVDGEPYHLEEPNFHVKLFPGRIPVFCNIPSVTGRPSPTK
ncbi:ceramide kinase-like isoform X1 [Mya arenaria]|uniref:ceramide kinase-like isoform X1 n=1 Tax=Mya arenaria TaxID=6604 RepID=UPI0022E2BB79|nr:ceramide kinase-like isoform X1 [Mya arenaria]